MCVIENIPDKFPSIYNSQYKKQIDVKLYNQIPYREIETWLKETTDCEDDCISYSTIGKYARYVKQHGGFEQLIKPEDLQQEDITYSQLFQKAINVSYVQLDELHGANLVNLLNHIFKHALPMHIKLDADVDGKIEKKVTHNLLEKVKQNREGLNDISSD